MCIMNREMCISIKTLWYQFSKLLSLSVSLNVLTLLVIQVVSLPTHHGEALPLAILVSFDGFRWDYLDKFHDNEVPNFSFIKNNGVHAKQGLKNAFITKTFPNHYSIVTGLYEESHGVVGNTMYDPVLNERFDLVNQHQNIESKWFDNGGEPIWVTNAGAQRHTGVVFWPGSAAPVNSHLPMHYLLYDENLKNETRIDILIEWFLDKGNPINLGLLYFSQPDGIGHEFGTDSIQLRDTIKGLDSVLGYLINRLNDTNLLSRMNLILTSDHGMTNTPEDKVINLNDYVNATRYQVFDNNPIASILPNEGDEDKLYDLFKNISPNLHVYRKAEIPDEYHYKNNIRIQPLLLVADLHYSIQINGSAHARGNHGYNNSMADMHPFFIASGPDFKVNYMLDEQFETVDIYPLLCHLLKITPAPNNGSLDRVSALLRSPEDEGTAYIPIIIVYFVVLPISVCIAAVWAVAACRQQHIWKRKFGGMGMRLNLDYPAFSPVSTTSTNAVKSSSTNNLLFSDSDDELSLQDLEQ